MNGKEFGQQLLEAVKQAIGRKTDPLGERIAALESRIKGARLRLKRPGSNFFETLRPAKPFAEAAPHDPLKIVGRKPFHLLSEHGHTFAIVPAQAR